MSFTPTLIVTTPSGQPVRLDGNEIVVTSLTAPRSREGALRVNAQAILNPIISTGFGLTDIPAGEDFFVNLVTTPRAVVLPAKNGAWDGQTRHYEIIIPIRLWFASPKDVSESFLGFEDLWTAAATALKTEENWTRSPPNALTVDGPTPHQTGTDPMVWTYDITLTFAA